MWKIGDIEINSKAILAPMAGVTGHPFRVLCKEQGAGLVPKQTGKVEEERDAEKNGGSSLSSR